MTAQPEFRGSALDYFGIWSTNLFLVILTLGLYSPWATVRKRKYLYGSTCLLNSPLDYHARPLAILNGRLVAILLLVLISLLSFFPIAEILFLPLFVLATPFLVALAYRFSLRNTSWRQVRFDFRGSGKSAFAPYFFWPSLAIMTLGLLLPYMRFRQLQYTTDNMEFCGQRFRFSGRAATLYKFYILALIAFFLVISAYFFFFANFRGFGFGPQSLPTIAQSILGYWGDILAFFAIVFVIPTAVYVAELRYRYNHTSFGPDIARFSSDISTGGMLWLSMTNLLAIILTLGLAIPWAAIRVLRYRLAHIQVHCESEERIDAMIGEAKGEASAIGEEIVEGLDVGTGIGI